MLSTYFFRLPVQDGETKPVSHALFVVVTTGLLTVFASENADPLE